MGAVLKAMVRSPQVVFWIVVFPTLLFIILASIFGGMAEGGAFRPQVGVVAYRPLDGILVWVLPIVYRFGIDGYVYPDRDSALDALKRGQVDVVLAPEFTSDRLGMAVYYTEVRMDSRLTADIVKAALSHGGDVDMEIVEVEGEHTPVDWFYYGILMMIPVEVGFMFIPSALMELMKGGLLKRFYLAGVQPARAVMWFVGAAVIISLFATASLVVVSRFWGTEVGGPMVWLGFLVGLVAFSIMGVAIFALMPGKGAEALGSMLFFTNIFLGGLTIPFAPKWGSFLPASSLKFFTYGNASLIPLVIWTAAALLILAIRFRGVFSLD